MLTPQKLEQIPKKFEKLMTELEDRVMQDIVRRIAINSEITRSADWQIHRLSELGKSKSEIKQYIQEALKLSDKQVEKLYKDIMEKEYAYYKKLYDSVGKDFISFNENKELQQLISATMLQTKEELSNITQSLGFAVEKEGKIVFKDIAKYYQDTLDNAVMDIASGDFDYNTVLKRTVQEMTKSGLRAVDYSSGWSNRVEVATRRAVMTGITQVTAKVNEMNAEELETDYFEVSYHSTARPSHQVWQGRVYSKDELISICGLGSGEGLCGWNCRHSYSPFIPGVSVRTYTDEQLDEMNKEENTPKEYRGKQYTKYEASQKQRKIETLMRKQRQDIKLLEFGGANEEDIINAKARYRSTMSQYVEFSEKMGLPQQLERVYGVIRGEKLKDTSDNGIINNNVTIDNVLGNLNINLDDYVPFGKYDPYENDIQEQVASLVGFDRKPIQVSNEQFENVKGQEIIRVVHSYQGNTAQEAYSNTINGPIRYSERWNSVFGRGIYFGDKSIEAGIISKYSEGTDNKIINAKINEKAKILEFKNQLEYTKDLGNRLSKVSKKLKEFYNNERSLLYILDGVDGIKIEANGYYCIFNRGVLIINE